MNKTRWLLGAGLFLLFHPVGAGQQVPANQVAPVLLQGTMVERESAIRSLKQIPAEQRPLDAILAARQELNRLRQELEGRRPVIAASGALAPAPALGEYLFGLLDVVADSADPAVIDDLVRFIGTGNRVIDAVAAFGEPAVSSVIQLATSDSDPVPALLTLRSMLTKPVRTPLAPESRTLIARVASGRLTGVQRFEVTMAALDLAAATTDVGLIGRVQAIRSSREQIEQSGITDTGRIEAVQDKARRVLDALDVK